MWTILLAISSSTFASYVTSKDFVFKNQYLYPEEIYAIVPY